MIIETSIPSRQSLICSFLSLNIKIVTAEIPNDAIVRSNVKKLLLSFNALIEQGHSILVIEHNVYVICSDDWVIDLGPAAGYIG
jgi:ABC-type uncharacterized transport system ATPase subunit